MMTLVLGLKVGDRVEHVKQPGDLRTITQIDWNLIQIGWGVTTCLVRWDGCVEDDIQWTNKLQVVEVEDQAKEFDDE